MYSLTVVTIRTSMTISPSLRSSLALVFNYMHPENRLQLLLHRHNLLNYRTTTTTSTSNILQKAEKKKAQSPSKPKKAALTSSFSVRRPTFPLLYQQTHKQHSTMSTTPTTTNLNQAIYLTADNAKNYIDNYDTVLLDCDGVLWGTDHTSRIKNIDGALQKLRASGKQILFVTNNSLHSTESFLNKFKTFGFEDVRREELFCVNSATAIYLKDVLKVKGSVYVIGTPAMEKELQAAGIDCFGVGPDPDPITREKSTMLSFELRDNVEAVLVGFDEHINYNKLYKAASYIRRGRPEKNKENTGSCLYLATSNVEIGTWIAEGHYRPATGVMAESVSAACGQEPLIIGKPSRFLFDCILKKFPDLNKQRTIMIGDSLKSDITFAHNVGIASGLVLTGASNLEDLSRTSENLKPTFYFESVGLFNDIF